jgi:O-antigen/teichoic acid export membrane protein
MQMSLRKPTSSKKKVASNTIYQLVGKAFSMSVTMLVTLIVARTYGRSEYGEFSLMQSWPAFFFIISDFGINAISVKDLTKDWSKAGKYFGNILILRLFLAVVLVAVLAVVLQFFPYSKDLLFGIRLSLLLIVTQSLYSTMNIIFQAKMRYDYSVIGYLIGYIVILLSIVVLTFFKVSVIWVNFSYVLGGLVTALVNYGFIKKLKINIDFHLDTKLLKYLLVQALPLGLMFIFSQMSFKEDALMLSFLRLPKEYGLDNTESVAIYALPYKIFEVALVVPAFFMNAVFPVLVKKTTQGGDALKKAFRTVIRYLILGGALAGVSGFLFSPLIVRLLGGVQFSQSVLVLKILSVGFIFYFVTSPLSWLVVTLDKQIYLPWIYLVSSLINLALNFIYIPRYSFYAAAVITHLSELVVLVLLIFAARRAWKIKYA